ncbi:FitA-like ribbon-helix-helix domain-containing protein [Bradyrhizobium sp.]|jgi:plasmid stability protein|uniref:FitA-like ribbon-helix-helix domain-containing protein n=1 Tax=Bradyrhizobium sp. TaxID=376 RepID=UPI003C423E00
MAQIIVRDVDDDVKERLRRRAAQHGQSMEAEVRDILRNAVKRDHAPDRGLGTEIVALFADLHLKKDEKIKELHGFKLRNPFTK